MHMTFFNFTMADLRFGNEIFPPPMSQDSRRAVKLRLMMELELEDARSEQWLRRYQSDHEHPRQFMRRTIAQGLLNGLERDQILYYRELDDQLESELRRRHPLVANLDKNDDENIVVADEHFSAKPATLADQQQRIIERSLLFYGQNMRTVRDTSGIKYRSDPSVKAVDMIYNKDELSYFNQVFDKQWQMHPIFI